MICCLLALLAAIPGVSLMRRRLITSHAGQAPCAVQSEHNLGRDLMRSVAAASVVVVLAAATVAIDFPGHDASRFPLGPICSALDVSLPLADRVARDGVEILKDHHA